jgi:3-methyladenine DNA glycosylase AlkC
MPDAFKHKFSYSIIQHLAHCFAQNMPNFDTHGFMSKATDKLEELELKQRSMQIVAAMRAYLPQDFEQVSEILLLCLCPMRNKNEVSDLDEHQHLLKGWVIMPLAEYVGIYGQADFNVSMSLLREMTKRFTSEFAIRYFIERDRRLALEIMRTWVMDESEHVRRLVSEGSRPRLPWGMQLKTFIEAPDDLFTLLELLKDDPSEYVRRSVANNLNDIAKDHPDKVIRLCTTWMKDANPNRVRLIKHACRTLIKEGCADALTLFGFFSPQLSRCELSLNTYKVKRGESIELAVTLESTDSASSLKSQSIMLDYIVHHQKANGRLAPKVFKWKQCLISNGKTITLKKVHSFKPVTTRKYYAGEHHVSLLINGKTFSGCVFELLD